MNSSLLRLGTGLIAALFLGGCAAETDPSSGFDDETEEPVGEAQAAITFTSLGGTLAPGSGPGVASWGADRLDVFVRGGDDAVWQKASTDGGATWSGWFSLGGVVNSDPAAVSWGPGRIDMVARGGTQLWHRAWDVSINGWTGWASLGGTATSGPAIASRTVGSLDVIVNGGAQLWQNTFSTTTGTWSGWGSLGAAFTSDPAAVSWGGGRLDVFGRGPNNDLLHRAYDPATGWSAWVSHGGVLSSGPSVASDGYGRLDVYVRGGTDLYRKSYRGDAWSGWTNLGPGIVSDPAAVAYGFGKIAVFGQAGNATLVTSNEATNAAPPYAPDNPVGAFFHANNGTRPPPASYGRGAGTVLDSCPAGMEMDGALCYPQCQTGYNGVGPVCWQICPSGYTDTGALCTYTDGPLTMECDWSWSSWTCSCPSNYTNAGLFCAANTFAKHSYGRGAGSPLTCNPSLEQDGALCYPRCQTGYDGIGPVCWLDSIEVGNVCASLYDPSLAGFAASRGWTTTYGFGAGVDIGASVAAETGVIYGKEGHYGCYVQTCGGIATEVGLNAWGSFGKTEHGFASIEGTSFMANAGATNPVDWSFGVNVEGATMVNTSGQTRDTYNFVIGNTLATWTLPYGGSTHTCQTWVTQLW